MQKTKDLLEEVKTLQKKIADLRIQEELLDRSVTAKAEALTDLRASLMSSKPEYLEVEKEHRQEMEKLQTRSIVLREEIDNGQDLIKILQVDINNTSKDLEARRKELNGVRAELDKATKELKSTLSRLNDEKDKLQKLITTRTTQLNALDIKLSGAKERLSAVVENTDARLEKVRKDEARLAVKQKDLEIYELRLRRKYPKEVFVLPE